MAKKKTVSKQDEVPEEEEEEEAEEEGQVDLKSIAKQVTGKVLAIAVVGLIVGILIGQVALPGLGVCLITLPGVGADLAPADDDVDLPTLELKVEKYLNDFMLGPQGFEGKITGIDSFDDDFYTVKLDIIQDGTVVDSTDVFLTKSGTAISGAVFFLDEGVVEPPVSDQTGNLSCEDVPKESQPLLEGFVVSYCPFGLQMQRILLQVANLVGSENIKVRYIGEVVNGEVISMHGEQEAEENLRQICIREEQPEKYWSYISEFIKEGNTETALTVAGVEKAGLNACTSDSSKGVKYAQADFDLVNSRGASASPTIFVNGIKINEISFAQSLESNADGRSPETLKSLLCCSFEQAPDQCSTLLSTEGASTGFSPEGTGNTGTGSC